MIGQLDTLRRVIEGLGQKRIEPLEATVAELKTQLSIILGNIIGISERLDRLEQAHANLERHMLDMLTNTLPSSTDRLTQLEHQVQDYVQRP